MNSTARQTKKKIIFTIVTVVSFFMAYFAVQHLTSKASFDTQLVEAANEMNKACPITVDEYTRLENVAALPNKTFQYNFALVDLYKADVNLDTVKKYVFPKVLKNIKTNPEMKTMRDNKTTFNYFYRDKTGKFVCKYIVTPEMYQ